VGENAIRKYDKQEVKIGTCENMYYIRYTDRDLVSPAENSLDCSMEPNLFWRLPYPDEDDVAIGEYKIYDRTEELINKDGMYYHDKEDVMPDCDHMGYVVLESIKNHTASAKYDTPIEMKPIIKCTNCNHLWRTDWADIRDYVSGALQARLDADFNFKNTYGNSLRDEMKDKIEDMLLDTLGDMTQGTAHELAADLADTVFDVLQFSPEKQDKPLEEWMD
jgi:hypothetical protein